MAKRTLVRLGIRADQTVDPPLLDAEAIERAKYEAEAARAEAAKMKKQLEDIQSKLPTDEQRAKWAELEAKELASEEERHKKAGEFDKWRTQINEKHQKELDEKRQAAENARAAADRVESELNDKLIGLAFSGASDWFGPTGKTVLIPEIAKTYFGNQVAIEVMPPVNGQIPERRVVVKDKHGTVIVDPKSGQPMEFSQAIGEVIEAHARKKEFLRGSGKVGSGSSGGDHGNGERDLSNLKASDFKDPKVRDAVRTQLESHGGLKIGPGFDDIDKQRRQRS